MNGGPSVNIGPGAAIPLRYLTRHVGIYGATGTGKTTTAAAMVERIAAHGVPVLVLDAKGDLESLALRAGQVLDPTGQHGATRRLDLGRMGPDAIARALELTEAQAGTLEICHAFARSRGLAWHDLADLKNLLGAIVNNRDSVSAEFGLVTPASVAAIQRALLRLDRTAPDAFGLPALDPFEAAEWTPDGTGNPAPVTVVRAAPFTATPGLYCAAVAHMLESLYRECAELGDVPAPGLCVFIDEAHAVFADAPRAIIHRLESVVRLIRSKGVGLIFATQSPADLPPAIAGQLATRVQHALRGSTRHGLAEIRAAADTLPGSHWKETPEQIKRLGVGQALVSVPGAGGVSQPCQLVRIQPGTVKAIPLSLDERTRFTASNFPDGPPPISPTPRGPILPPGYFDRPPPDDPPPVKSPTIEKAKRNALLWGGLAILFYGGAFLS